MPPPHKRRPHHHGVHHVHPDYGVALCIDVVIIAYIDVISTGSGRPSDIIASRISVSLPDISPICSSPVISSSVGCPVSSSVGASLIPPIDISPISLIPCRIDRPILGSILGIDPSIRGSLCSTIDISPLGGIVHAWISGSTARCRT